MKILKRNSILFIVISSLWMLSGCEKYLDVKSDSRLVTPNSLESFQQLLDEANSMNYSTNSFGEGSADDYFITNDTYSSLHLEGRNMYVWKNFIYNYDNDWAKAYISVYTSNVILDNIKKIEKTAKNQSDWHNIYGSALFYRAHSYIHSVWTYAKAYDPKTAENDLGIVLRESSDPTIPSVRSSVNDCYSRIVSDLKEASKALPLQPFHVLRPSKCAAYGLLARTYLSIGKYEEALTYADSAIMISPELLDYNEVEVPTTATENPFRRFNKETIFYSQMLGYAAALGLGYVDTLLFDHYAADDLRKLLFFGKAENGYHQFRGTYSEDTHIKFTGITSAEMYLIKAECQIRLNQLTDGVKTINILIKHRYKNDSNQLKSNTAKDVLLYTVLLERRKELVFRGVRWIDIKRLNRDGFNIELRRAISGETISLKPNDNGFALPLPDDVIRATGMQQNPK
ncbi:MULTISPECIES: RagB/SusD family nutrient uptake outer membrane protein [Sphingobacterium]|uniref:RagB/SusD family nutrient uptake outer membrane protein n=1 Tax=Sphingobacterium TaxID=28453 RepID=UPI00257DC4CD|nr:MULTISPECIES: RagB/SusD family nutrient uptake outer membrane protein [Sphingobacterium]